MEFEQLFTVYGPLGFGWVFAIYLLKQNAAMQERIMTAFLADTEAKGMLRATIERLISIVENK